MPSPILPRNMQDPTGQDRRERAAMRAFRARLAQVQRVYLSALAGIPYSTVQVNALVYEFELDPDILANLLAEIAAAVDRILLEGGADRLWFTQDYVLPAYQQGTAANWANLGAQSEAYAASGATLDVLLLSPAYQRRIGYLRARQFENMAGFTSTAKTQLSRILSDGLATGQNPRTIAAQLRDQMGVEQRRADRIARTEVPNALRQARLDEAQQATIELGIRSVEMHLSALSPTTREDHAARHATLHSVVAQRTWWSMDGNSINCKCSTVTVLINERGEPLTPGIVAKARAMR